MAGDFDFKSGTGPKRATSAKVVAVLYPGFVPEPEKRTEPRPLAGSFTQDGIVRDVCAWMLVAMPIVSSVVDITLWKTPFLLPFFANSLLVFLDAKQVKYAGAKKVSGWWGVFLIPVYFWKRDKSIRQQRIFFWAWLFSFFLAMGIIFAFDHSYLEDSARPLVTKIVREQLNGDTSCVRVRVTKHVSDNHYRGIATMSNGETLRITIESRGDMIYVTIPPQ